MFLKERWKGVMEGGRRLFKKDRPFWRRGFYFFDSPTWCGSFVDITIF
jgi:hypothetical protein